MTDHDNWPSVAKLFIKLLFALVLLALGSIIFFVLKLFDFI